LSDVPAGEPPLLEVRDLAVRHGDHDALRDVNFTLQAGQALAVVGESGSGKTSLVRALLRLQPLSRGQVLLRGVDLAILSASELRARRRDLQLVFQDPVASLDPMMNVLQLVSESLRAHEPALTAVSRRQRVIAQLQSLGVSEEFLARRPRELSGGQAQRVAIARALITNPAVLVCDEPVAALDLSLRAQVLDLLVEQRKQRQLALLFVTHDLAAARSLCDQVLVLHRGAVVEQGSTRAVFSQPRQDYTRSLISAALTVDVVQARARRRLFSS
jgi:oligopeptide transport system ATP-binding protein